MVPPIEKRVSRDGVWLELDKRILGKNKIAIMNILIRKSDCKCTRYICPRKYIQLLGKF
jgi:hypothetical protein